MTTTRVVCIGTGETLEVAIESRPYGDVVWRLEHLKKDGGFSKTRVVDGSMTSRGDKPAYLTDFALFDIEREWKAVLVRRVLAKLREQQAHAEQVLLALYREQP